MYGDKRVVYKFVNKIVHGNQVDQKVKTQRRLLPVKIRMTKSGVVIGNQNLLE